MKNNDYEPNIIRFFTETLRLKSGISYLFKETDNVIDDGYISLEPQKDIPVQLVQATDFDLEKTSSIELNKKGYFQHKLLNSSNYIEKAIELKSNKNYSHSNQIVLLIDMSRCDPFIEDNLKYIKSISKVQQFKAVYAFYPNIKPTLISIKEYKNN